ncbi:MAG: acyl-CoA dehydrogenase [Desulfobacterales bacterium]|nr:acyl-CoA dehydrogenase [Desulfobacterales bacterium]
MNFDFTKQENELFASVYQEANEIIQNNDIDSIASDKVEQAVRESLKKLAKTGYLNLGLNNQKDSLLIMGVMEQLSSLSQSLCLIAESSTRILGKILSTWGTENQKEKWLKSLMKGEIISATAISENSMNVYNEPLKTAGVKDSDSIIVNGEKNYVVNAPWADIFAVVGVLDNCQAVFLIEKNTQGLQVTQRLYPMGYEGVSISGISLNDCRISSDNVIIIDKSINALSKIKLWENQILIGLSLGLMKSSFIFAKSFSNSHKTGGKPIIAYQEIAFKLADMLALYQTSQLFAYRSAWLVDNDEKEAESVSFCAKIFATESSEKVVSNGMQILGASGYMSKNPIEKAMRCVKYGQIAGTSSEIARVKIGDDILKMN